MNENMMYIDLYDIYGKLLTKKQQKTFHLYFMCDLSLREIAENEDISFQAVRDSLENAKRQLLEFESIVKMNEYKNNIECLKNTIKQENINNEKVNKIIKRL